MAEVERTREFIPNDIIEPSLDERKQKLDSRLDELRAKRDTFDPETQFVGIRRLGSSYTIAEPFAYFDGLSEKQLRFNRITYISSAAIITAGVTMLAHQTMKMSYAASYIRAALLAIPGGYLGSKVHEWRLRMEKKKYNVFFSYALLHEKDFPVIERKKYDEIIRDYTSHRSLNILGNKWRW